MSRPSDVSALLSAHKTAITFSVWESRTGWRSTSERTLQKPQCITLTLLFRTMWQKYSALKNAKPLWLLLNLTGWEGWAEELKCMTGTFCDCLGLCGVHTGEGNFSTTHSATAALRCCLATIPNHCSSKHYVELNGNMLSSKQYVQQQDICDDQCSVSTSKQHVKLSTG